LLREPETRRLGAPLLLWSGFYIAAYTAAAIHRYDWYQTPLIAALAGLGGIGLCSLARRLVSPRRVLVAGAAVLCAAASLDMARAVVRAGGNEGVLGVERVRYEAALWMRDTLPAGSPIATGGIGLVGYHTNRRILDAMGLVTPGSMRYDYAIVNPRTVPFPRFLPAIIADYQPEFVFDGFWLRPGEEMPDFMRGRYGVMRVWRGTDPSWPPFILYRRLSPAVASP
jgi:hypothetical protein